MSKFVLTVFVFLNLVSSQEYYPSMERGHAAGFMLINHSLQTDTCIIEGLVFDVFSEGESNGMKAIIKNGRIKIISSKNPNPDFKVIRYVFSIRRDEKISSVRHYGDLVSYPVILLLKNSEPGDVFHFEDIIIANPGKEILHNAVKPIIIKRL
jgi:hypothetical protein